MDQSHTGVAFPRQYLVRLESWSYALVADRTHDGKAFRMLTVIDEHGRECLAIHVQRRLKSDDGLVSGRQGAWRQVWLEPLACSCETAGRPFRPNRPAPCRSVPGGVSQPRPGGRAGQRRILPDETERSGATLAPRFGTVVAPVSLSPRHCLAAASRHPNIDRAIRRSGAKPSSGARFGICRSHSLSLLLIVWPPPRAATRTPTAPSAGAVFGECQNRRGAQDKRALHRRDGASGDPPARPYMRGTAVLQLDDWTAYLGQGTSAMPEGPARSWVFDRQPHPAQIAGQEHDPDGQ